MDRKKELEQVIFIAKNELWKIEKEERKEDNQKYIGKYFKYRNSYSCPTPEEHWWFYMAITGVGKDGDIISWSFQKDIYEHIEIEINNTSTGFLNDCTEISKTEFWIAFSSIVGKVNTLLDSVE